MPHPRAFAVLLAALVATGCKKADKAPDTSSSWPRAAPVEEGWLRGDLHFHTNHSDDALNQGGDWMKGALAIADAWRDPAWVEANPGREDDHLHFIAVTDHRTTDGLSDRDFEHDYLVVVGGEEFGSDGHAGIWGIRDHVPHEPQAGESPNERLNDAIAEARAQGGLFSPNHPLYAGDLWGWDTPDVDAIEVWNGPWSILGAPTSEEQLDAWVASKGVENPMIRTAIGLDDEGQNGQALRFWQAGLSLGRHVPIVGGGDRHMLFPAGLPTTYVLTESRDEAGIIAGIKAGHTFVSYSPQGPQVVLTAIVDGVEYPMGSALPGATSVEVHWRVTGAEGGDLFLFTGVVDDSMPPPRAAGGAEELSNDASGTFLWNPPASGGWLHAMVNPPLPDVPPEFQDTLRTLKTFPEDDDIAGLVLAVGPLLDTDNLGNPERCDPSRWEAWQLQCMPADEEPLGSYYVPIELQPLLAVEFIQRRATGYAMGAITSAFHTAPK